MQFRSADVTNLGMPAPVTSPTGPNSSRGQSDSHSTKVFDLVFLFSFCRRLPSIANAQRKQPTTNHSSAFTNHAAPTTKGKPKRHSRITVRSHEFTRPVGQLGLPGECRSSAPDRKSRHRNCADPPVTQLTAIFTMLRGPGHAHVPRYQVSKEKKDKPYSSSRKTELGGGWLLNAFLCPLSRVEKQTSEIVPVFALNPFIYFWQGSLLDTYMCSGTSGRADIDFPRIRVQVVRRYFVPGGGTLNH